MVNWAGVVSTTITKHIRKVEPAAVRRRPINAMLQKMGRITYNHSGQDMDWRTTKKRTGLQPLTDMQLNSFGRVNRYDVARLPWRGGVNNEAVSYLDELKNRSAEAIVRFVDDLVTRLTEDSIEDFHKWLWIDGEDTSLPNRMHGVESIFKHTGSALTGNARVLTPNSTYAGLEMGLGVYGGTWDTESGNSIWPAGDGDILYEFWMPTIIDYRSNLYNGATTWKGNAIDAMRYALTCADSNERKSDGDLVFVLDRDLLHELKSEMGLKERIQVQRGPDVSPLVALGFKAVGLDGYDVISDQGVKRASTGTDKRVGYLLNLSQMELCSMNAEIFDPKGPEWNMERAAYLVSIYVAGNYRFFSPRHQTKLIGL